MNQSMQKGFTLIELMIVVAIIGILAAVAVPQYQNYVTRARWADNNTVVEATKAAISECLQMSNGALTSCDTTAELNTVVGYSGLPTGTFVSSVTITATTAAIVVAGTAAAASCTVTWTPAVTTNAVTWTGATSGTSCSKTQTSI